jgi:outer membrane protein
MTKKVLIGIVAAQTLLFSYTTNFDEAVKQALKNNKELKAKQLDVEKAKKDVEEAKSYKLGKLEFNENISNTNHAGYVFGMKLAQRRAQFMDFGFDQFLSQMPALMGGDPSASGNTLSIKPDKLNHPEAITNFESKLVYEVPLYTGGKLDSAKEMAYLQVRANEAKYARDEKLLGLEILKAYNGAVTAKNFIKITEDSKKIAAGFIKKSKKLYNDGLIRKFEVEQAQTAYKSIDIKLQEAKTNFSLAIAYLQFLTDNKDITDVGEMKTFPKTGESIAAIKEEAITKRDDYAYMDYNVKTMKEKVAFESSDSLPTIGAHLEYGFNDGKPLNASADKSYYLAAVGLKYTIFDGDLTSIKKQKATVEYKKVQNYQEYMKNGIALEVQQHYENLQTENKTLSQKIEVAKTSRNILHEIEEVYADNLKFRTEMMYLLMQLGNLVQSEADVAMAKYNKSLAEANLKLAIGESLSN